MNMNKCYDVIIIGGSYAGLAAAMALGRALQEVLMIDNGQPCNAQTPQSHNFLTRDGSAPRDIATIARQQVEAYPTITFLADTAINGLKTETGFAVEGVSGNTYHSGKLIIATGIKDILPDIPGLAECWGISVLHCPFCHGYEVRNEKTGIIANGKAAYELVSLIANWTNDLTLFTNGPSTLTAQQTDKIKANGIAIIQTEIEQLANTDGNLNHVVLKSGTKTPVVAAYIRAPFRQACQIPEQLGCAITEDGYIQIDATRETSVKGVFASGDNSTNLRTLANAVATGNTAGMVISKQIITAAF